MFTFSAGGPKDNDDEEALPMTNGSPLLDDPSLSGFAYVHARSEAADTWLAELFRDAVSGWDPGTRKRRADVALVATGGYGRGELWPYSDLDVVLLHRGCKNISELAEKLWYPVWDRGLKLGHGVFTVKESTKLAADELEHATSMLSARHIAGDFALCRELTDSINNLWESKTDEMLEQLRRLVSQRHHQVSDVALTIEPQLKEGRGGLRDLQALAWAEQARPGFASISLSELHDEARILTEIRVELHRLRGRAGDVLSLDDQDGVAEALGETDGQTLMYHLALAARRVAWYSDNAWSMWERQRNGQTLQDPTPVGAELELIDDQVELRLSVEPDSDELLILKVAVAAARMGKAIGRRTLVSLQQGALEMPVPWPREARNLFAALFQTGRNAIPVVEDLDHFGLMSWLIPEWENVRAKPQRNVFHTFTVDRHLLEAAANAAAFSDSVVRPDLLVVGALLHDIGKGVPGDHTEVGMELIGKIGTRMGYPAGDVGVLIDLCANHLLLPDVATRRDIADPGTLRAVAAAVRTSEFLDLLYALTRADSIATGPSAWGSWKAGLLRDLVSRTHHVLGGGAVDQVTAEFPGPDLVALMETGEESVVGRRNELTVIARDVAGLFGRLAGVLAMTGLEVLDAAAFSDDKDMAVCQFTIQEPHTGPVDWSEISLTVELALAGRLALSARVAKRARSYGKYRRRLSAQPPIRLVDVDNSISDIATVVDVHSPDTIGLLFRLTRAINELDLDIRSARVQTLGPDAVDSFYLCDSFGQKIFDQPLLKELELAFLEAMGDDE